MSGPEIPRRRVLLLGAAATGAVWAAPAIVAVDRATARDAGSRPPSSPPRYVAPPLPAPTAEPDMGPPLPDEIRLAYTGNNERAELELGVAALTAGAALVALTHERRAEGGVV